MRAISISSGLRCAVALSLWLLVGSARAADPVMDFVRALESAHYGEVGIDYLESLKAQNKLPKELQDSYELQIAIFTKYSVAEAFNKTEAEQREAKYKALAKKFIDEHPDGADTARAREILGESALQRALTLLAEAKNEKDKTAAAKQMEDARKSFQEAKPGIASTVAAYHNKFLKLKEAGVKGATAKQKQASEQLIFDSEVEWQDARRRAAMIDYFIAQTYLDPKSGPRKEAFKTAAKEFDAIYQENRDATNLLGVIGLYAHVWDGKCADELGNETLAMDIYDEVGTREEADPTDKKGKEASGLESLLAENAQARMQITLRKKGVDVYAEEALEWLKQWDAGGSFGPDTPAKKAYRATDGYQAISLQLAKILIDKSEAAAGADKNKMLDAARKRLRDVAKVRSESQLEAIHLVKKLSGGEGGGGGPTNVSDIKDFAEAAGEAEKASQSGEWEPALAYYKRAIELLGEKAAKEKDKKRAAEMQTGLEQASYAVAVMRFSSEKLDEAYELASQVAKSTEASSDIAPKAAALCARIRLAQASAVKNDDPAKAQQERDDFLNRLQALGRYSLEKWGDRPEADDVRISLGRGAVLRGQLDEAIKALEQVNPRSERSAQAQQISGQLHFHKYALEKSKPESARDKAVVEAEREKAEKQLTTGLENLRKTPVAKGEPLPEQLVDVIQLLADVKFEKGAFGEAAELLQPVINDYKVHKPATIDKNVLKSFMFAVKGYNGAGQFDKGGATAETLIDLGDTDTPEVNSISVNFVRLLAEEYKVGEVTLADAKSEGDPKKIESAEQRLFNLKGTLSKLLKKLESKQNHSLAGRIYMGDVAAKIGSTDVAETLYNKALEQAEKEKTEGGAESPALKAIPRIRAQVVGLLQQKGKYEEGIIQIDKLIAEQPKALEPKVVRARLLQAWAEEKRDPVKLQTAAKEWAELRNKLKTGRTKLPEFYEANYYVALCLWMEYEATKDPKHAGDARKVLHTMMLQSSTLSGPEMVAKYKQLMGKINKAIGEPAAAPSAAAADKTKPVATANKP